MKIFNKKFSAVGLAVIILGLVVFVPAPARALVCNSGTTAVVVLVKNPTGGVLPGMNIRVHAESQNIDGAKFLGTILITAKTNSTGQWQGCLPTRSAYAVNVYQYSPTIGNLTIWSDAIVSENGNLVARVTMSGLRWQIQNGAGVALKNYPFEIFPQQLDANGQPVFTRLNRIGQDLTTGETAQRTIWLGPGTYVFRFRGNLGHVFIKRDVVVSAAEIQTIIYRFPTLRARTINGLGRPVASYRFSVHRQSPEGQTLEGNALFSGRTGRSGLRDLHLPPGRYVMSTVGSFHNHVFRQWDIVVTDHQLTTGTLTLSGLRVAVVLRPGAYAADARVTLATQRNLPGGRIGTGTRLIDDEKIGEIGYRDIYLSPGTYLVRSGALRLTDVDVFEKQFTRVDFPKNVLVRVSDEVSLSTPLNNIRTSLRPATFPSLAGLRGTKTALSKAYRLRGTLHAPVTIVFYFPARQLSERGLDASKIRVAFLDEKNKWRLLGRYDRLRGQVGIQIRSRGVIVLVST